MPSSGINVRERTDEVTCDLDIIVDEGTDDEHDDVCGFEGEATTSYDPEEGTVVWTCPRCGGTHEVSADEYDQPDPDADRGEW